MSIQCIFFSEFDNIVGPKIVYQTPHGFLTPEVWEEISVYVITKPQVCDKLVTWTTTEYVFHGFPQIINGQQYHRNHYLFNCVFVLPRHIKTTQYKPVVKKFASMLRALEVESGFLYKEESKHKLQEILSRLLIDLNTRGESVIPIDAVNTINLKLFPIFTEPPLDIPNHLVPVRIRDFDMQTVLEDWDLAQQKIIPYINGINFVKAIAFKSGVDINLVKQCLRHLIYYDYIKMVDIFQFSNMYCIASKQSFAALFHDEKLQIECLNYVLRASPHHQSAAAAAAATPMPISSPPNLDTSSTAMSGGTHALVSFTEIVRIYCSMRFGVRLSQIPAFQSEQIASFVDFRALIAYGVIKGFLRRIYEYPIIVSSPKLESDAAASTPPPSPASSPAHTGSTNIFTEDGTLSPELQSWFTGQNSCDEICCHFGISRTALDEKIRHLNKAGFHIAVIAKEETAQLPS